MLFCWGRGGTSTGADKGLRYYDAGRVVSSYFINFSVSQRSDCSGNSWWVSWHPTVGDSTYGNWPVEEFFRKGVPRGAGCECRVL